MSMSRTLIRRQARNEDRLEMIVMGRAKVGNTKHGRMAIAGNNPSAAKQVKTAQRKQLRMRKHARLVVGLLIRAAGGNAPLVLTVDVPKLDAHHQRIAIYGTTITRPSPGELNMGPESRL
jgi:hypothetical protein